MNRYSFLALTALAVSSFAAKWNMVTQGPWDAREGLMGTFFKGKIYMSGGRSNDPDTSSDGTKYFNDVWSLDTKCMEDGTTCVWVQETASAEWPPRADHIMFDHFPQDPTHVGVPAMYVVAGRGPNGFLQDTWSSTDGKTWRAVAYPDNPPPWHPRAGLVAGSSGGDMVIAGGFYESPSGSRTDYNDVWRSEGGADWELVSMNRAAGAMTGRANARGGVVGNKLYIVGGEYGINPDYQGELADVWSLDLATTKWKIMTANAPFTNRSRHGFFVDNDGWFYVIAGYSKQSAALHDVWRSKDSGKSWTQIDEEVFGCQKSDSDCGGFEFWTQLDNVLNDVYVFGGELWGKKKMDASNGTFVLGLSEYS